MIETVLFSLFSAAAVLSALYTIASANILRGALSLIVTFFSVAALYVLLHADLLAAVQIIVYAGAIMVLILFVIFLTGFSDPGPERFLANQRPAAVTVAVVLFLELVLLASRPFLRSGADLAGAGRAKDSIARFAEALFLDYLLPFELLSIALLAALVASLHLARKRIEGP